jgi:hypothetical protein
MKKSVSWPLVGLAAVAASLAGCAAEPAAPKTAAEPAVSCVGVAPTTGTMLRRKEDCVAEKGRAPMTEEELRLYRQQPGALSPRAGAGSAQ